VLKSIREHIHPSHLDLSPPTNLEPKAVREELEGTHIADDEVSDEETETETPEIKTAKAEMWSPTDVISKDFNFRLEGTK